MNTRKLSITELTMMNFILFAVFTIIQGFNALTIINRIWMIVAIFTALTALLLRSMKRIQVAMLGLTILIHVLALFFTQGELYNANMLFYLALWVLFYVFVTARKEKIMASFQISTKFIDGILWSWTVIVGLSVFLPSSYTAYQHYFISFTGTTYRLMPSALIITALAIYRFVKTNCRKYDFFLCLPCYAEFMGGSRTYFGVFIIFMIMYMYMRFNKATFLISLIPAALIIVYVISISSIGAKIKASAYSTNSYFDYWGTITSGRSIFWVWDIKAFFNLPFGQQFIGNGYNFVYEINSRHMKAIWAHNDVINILMNFGYLGLTVYLWSFVSMVKLYLSRSSSIPILVKTLFLLAVFVNSMLNMSYTYLCAMISYPLFLIGINERYTVGPATQPDQHASLNPNEIKLLAIR